MEKICFVMANYFKYYMGGAELQAYLIAKQLTKSVEVHYLFMKHPNFNKIKFQKNDDGIILHPMRQYVSKIFGKFFFMNYQELHKLLDGINPDLIYQRGGKPYIGIAARWCKRNNKKLVLGTSMERNCSNAGILKANTISTYPSSIINGFFALYGIKNVNLLIVQNQHQQQLLRKNFGRDSVIITNGHHVPPPPFKIVDPPVISWVANIKTLKQPELFIKLAENCQDLNVRFLYAGRLTSGPYQKMLLEKTSKLSNLEYLGEIPFEETNDLLSKSSIFVNTSITEGFSNTYIQAWMRETPVVTLNCDPDDVIKNHKIGFHSGSFQQLTKDVRYLIENEDVRREMGKNAREYALKNHDIKNIGKMYLKVFERLVNE